MKHRTIEFLKDLLIVLLLCSLAFFSLLSMPVESIRSVPWLSTILQPAAPLLGLPQAELTYVEPALPVMDAAQPLAISVRNSAGRTTALWDFSTLDSAFEALGGVLGEALDTAGAFSPVTEHDVMLALSFTSVYYQYGLSLPPELLASWLDAQLENKSPIPAYGFALAPTDRGTVDLYLVGSSYYAAETQVSPDSLTALLEQYRPDSSTFAFESFVGLHPWSLLPGENPKLPAAASAPPCDSRYTEQLATAFGFNPYGDASYTDTEGVTYFTEVGCSLQVSPAGEISLTSSAPDRFRAMSTDTDVLVEEARRLVELAAGDALGDARLYLSGLTRQGDTTVCTFDYVLSGVPVVLPGRSAATVVFTGSSMTDFHLLLKTYTQSTQTLHLLPPVQAAVLLPEGGRLTLLYQDSGTGTLTAGWRD